MITRMNMLAGGSGRKLFAFVSLCSSLAFGGGCSSSPAASQPQFTAMPTLLGGWGGGHQNYVTILGPVTGTGSKSFTIPARTGLGAWVGCIGKGLVWLKGAISGGAACGDGSTWAGSLTQPTHLRIGQKVAVRIIAAPGVRWEFRIDGTPPQAS